MKHMKTKSLLPILLGVIFIFFITNEAFSTTQFRVTVRGDQGQLVVNALVSISGSGVALQAKSDSQGVAVFSLPNGTFKIEASFPAYAKPAVGTVGIPQQQTGTVVFPANPILFLVYVFDVNNKPVGGASVRVLTAADNVMTATTGVDGRVQFSVPKGVVKSVDVTAPGFQSGNMSNIQVNNPTGIGVSVFLRSSSMPSITLTSPKGGEVFQPGTLLPIRWTYTGDIGTEVAINLNASNGYSQGGLAVKVIPGGNGSYDWRLPAKGEVVNRNWTVTLSSVRNNNIGATSKTFYIEGPYITIEEKFGPRITVTSPKAGDVWTLGSTQTIRWTYKGDPPGPDVKLFPIYKGTLVDPITLKTPIGSGGNGSYNWKIPNMPDGNNYTIKIMGTQNEQYRGESGNFSIMQPKASINIISPRAGDTWKEGSTRTITWTCNNASVFAVNIGLLYGGSTVTIIAKDLKVMANGSGSYNWVIPRLPSPSGGDYSIKIVAFLYGGGPIEANSARFIIAQ